MKQEYLESVNLNEENIKNKEFLRLRRLRNKRFRQAYDYFHNKDYDHAIDLLHKNVSQDPKDLGSLELIYQSYLEKKDWIRALGTVVLLIKYHKGKKFLAIKSATAIKYYMRNKPDHIKLDSQGANYFFQLGRIQLLILERQLRDGYYSDVRKHTRLITKNFFLADHFGHSNAKIIASTKTLKKLLQDYSQDVALHVDKEFKKGIYDGEKLSGISKNDFDNQGNRHDIYKDDVEYRDQAISKRVRKRNQEKEGDDFQLLAQVSYIFWKERLTFVSDRVLPASLSNRFELDLNIKGICPGLGLENTRNKLSWSLKACPFYSTGSKDLATSTGYLSQGQNKIFGFLAGPGIYYHFGIPTFKENLFSVGVEAQLFYRRIQIDTGPQVGVLTDTAQGIVTGLALRARGGSFLFASKLLISPIFDGPSLAFELGYIF